MDDRQVKHALIGFPAAAIRFVQALERNREAIGHKHGLSPTDLRALFHIGEVVSLTPKQLAFHMEMTTGAITAIATRLFNAGLVQRVDHPNDRRSLYLELSGQGHELMVEIHRDFENMIAAATDSLSADEVAAFESALETVADEVFSRMSL